jgi:hypothetical protein
MYPDVTGIALVMRLAVGTQHSAYENQSPRSRSTVESKLIIRMSDANHQIHSPGYKLHTKGTPLSLHVHVAVGITSTTKLWRHEFIIVWFT